MNNSELRDIFAGIALHGLLAGDIRPAKTNDKGETQIDWNRDSFAVSAYLYADAMISARTSLPPEEQMRRQEDKNPS